MFDFAVLVFCCFSCVSVFGKLEVGVDDFFGEGQDPQFMDGAGWSARDLVSIPGGVEVWRPITLEGAARQLDPRSLFLMPIVLLTVTVQERLASGSTWCKRATEQHAHTNEDLRGSPQKQAIALLSDLAGASKFRDS